MIDRNFHSIGDQFMSHDGIKVSRKYQDFKGKNIIVGCGQDPENHKGECVHASKDFYTIDFNPDRKPDLEHDFMLPVSKELIPDNACEFIFFENIDEKVLTGDKSQAIQTAGRMLSENGFLLYRGGFCLILSHKITYNYDVSFLEKISDEGFKFGLQIDNIQYPHYPLLGSSNGIEFLLSKSEPALELSSCDPFIQDHLFRLTNRNTIKLLPIEDFIESLRSKIRDARQRSLLAWQTYQKNKKEDPETAHERTDCYRQELFIDAVRSVKGQWANKNLGSLLCVIASRIHPQSGFTLADLIILTIQNILSTKSSEAIAYEFRKCLKINQKFYWVASQKIQYNQFLPLQEYCYNASKLPVPKKLHVVEDILKSLNIVLNESQAKDLFHSITLFAEQNSVNCEKALGFVSKYQTLNLEEDAKRIKRKIP